MFIYQTFKTQLDQLPSYSCLPQVSSATKDFATLILKGFGFLLTGYTAVSLAERVAKFDKNTIAAAIVILVIVTSVAVTVKLTVFVVKKLHEKHRREFDAIMFEYGVLAKEWDAYNVECEEFKIVHAVCGQTQETIKQKIQKLEDLCTEINVLSESDGLEQEKLASMVREERQDVEVLDKLEKENTEFVCAVSTWNDSLNERYKRLNAWQTELDKKCDKITGEKSYESV